MNTFFLNIGKFYWWLFTDKQLNSDTLVRLAYAHYISAFFLFYLGVLHSFDMHYDWKNDTSYDGLEIEVIWWDEALSNELTWSAIMFMAFAMFCWFLYPDPEALSYEIFMWGDIGLVNDIRFYGVAPHWYFRAYMAWLIVCPYHNTGIFGLLFFFILLFIQPIVQGNNHQLEYNKKSLIFSSFFFRKKYFYKNSNVTIYLNFFYQFTFTLFVLACLCAASFLPYGRFYNRLGGNIGMLCSYIYLFMYLTFNFLRRSNYIDMYLFRTMHQFTHFYFGFVRSVRYFFKKNSLLSK